MMLYTAGGHFTCKFTVFCEGRYNFGDGFFGGDCRAQLGHKKGQHAYTWANVGVFNDFYMQIRSA